MAQINEKQDSFESRIKEDIINQVKEDLKKELSDYKKAQLDPKNSLTIGTTKAEVKRIMGVPDQIQPIYDTVEEWHYGRSIVQFTDGKVPRYDNADQNLKLR